eukprot:gene21792-64453_t
MAGSAPLSDLNRVRHIEFKHLLERAEAELREKRADRAWRGIQGGGPDTVVRVQAAMARHVQFWGGRTRAARGALRPSSPQASRLARASATEDAKQRAAKVLEAKRKYGARFRGKMNKKQMAEARTVVRAKIEFAKQVEAHFAHSRRLLAAEIRAVDATVQRCAALRKDAVAEDRIELIVRLSKLQGGAPMK